MSIIIKGRNMPENCQECFCLNDEYFYCQAMSRKPSDENVIKKRPDWCPLVPVPDHGRLIDVDALIERVIIKYLEHESKGELVFAAAEIKQDIVDLISDAPTIIPAEESET